MNITAVRCEVIPNEDLPTDKSKARVMEFIRAQDFPHEFVVSSKLIRWLDNKAEQAYLKVENLFSPIDAKYVGLIAQIHTGNGYEDLSIHPDDFLSIRNKQSYF